MWRANQLNALNFIRRTNCNVSQAKPEYRKSFERDLKERDEIEGFVVKKVASVPEFHLTAVKLKHQRTGAQYLHLAREDNNNAFCVGFRTTPTDSTGLPHILEHTTLCGSQRYPCRDPFFKMLNRSMATFMNAMTGPDYTIYPFSTQNKKDFANLMSVYLDAVFHPNLKESDFRQEGWRLEHAETQDKNSPIIIKGVVYNEMKGAFSENQTLFVESMMNNILPSHTYGVISGGDPMVIPTLTYRDLKDFHKKFYHPSNCRFYSYGNFPLVEHLKYINKQYLADFLDGVDYSKLSEVPPEQRWTGERRKHISCRMDPIASNVNKQSSIAISSLCTDIRSVPKTFALQVLTNLLVKGPNAPFYKTLIEPGIGGGFSPVTGYESHTRDTIFSVGLQGVSPADFDRIVELYHDTISETIDHGFEENHINAVLHNIELGIKHQSADFGLSVLFGISPLWNHEGDVIQALKLNHLVEKFRRTLVDNPLYLQDLIQEYLKDNDHRLILTMSPDPAYEDNQIKHESEILAEKTRSLAPYDKENIFVQGIQLMKEQETKQDPNCLPTLSVSDLNSDVDRTTLEGLLMQSVPVQVCTAPTNGIIYFRGVLNTNLLSDKAKELLPLFCYIMTKMGTNALDYRQLDQLIQLKTGGLHLYTHVAENIFDMKSFEEAILIYSYCLSKNSKAMFNLWENLFNSMDFSIESRFSTLLQMLASDLTNGICDAGHQYAMSASSALVSPSARAKEAFGGLTLVRKMKKLSLLSDISEPLEVMKGIGQTVLSKKYFRASLNIYPGSEEKVFPAADTFLSKVRGDFEAPFVLSTFKQEMCTRGIHYLFNFPINHTAMSIPTVQYSHEDFPALRVLAKLLTFKYLLPNVREKGGAYGAGANISNDGIFNFFSYRDPKPERTFDTFNRCRDWINMREFGDQDVDEAKLCVFQTLDSPIPPGNRGLRNFLFGISDDELQRQRQNIIKLNRDDLIRVSSYLGTGVQGRALIGPKNDHISERTSELWELRASDHF